MRLKCTHTRPTQKTRRHTFTSLNHARVPKLLLWTGIYMLRATMVCKRDGITARHGNETALSPPRFLPILSSFLPSFLPRYIYVTISGSSIELPRMSELSKEKQTVYLRRSSLMHNIVCPSTRLSQMERKPSTIRILTYSTYSTRDDVLSDCPIHLLLLPAELNGKFCSVEKAIHLSSIQFFCSNYLVAFYYFALL